MEIILSPLNSEPNWNVILIVHDTLMSLPKPKFLFEVLINESFGSINDDIKISPTHNKAVFSAINDYNDGIWCFDKFQNFIWNNVAETSLSSRERDSLIDQSHSLLTTAAKSLRLTDADGDIGRGSELAEIVLYGIMKHHYKALAVVPKIFYKQNSQDNAKGADSVHIVIENDNFSIWLGEAKFYSDIEDARLAKIVSSIETSLQTEKIRKENSIIVNVGDIDHLIRNKAMRSKIREMLDATTSIDKLKPLLHVPILLLHECEITKFSTSINNEYRKKIIEYHTQRAKAYFKKQASTLGKRIVNYSQINFHLILFPVPEKEAIVERFLSNVKHYKG